MKSKRESAVVLNREATEAFAAELRESVGELALQAAKWRGMTLVRERTLPLDTRYRGVANSLRNAQDMAAQLLAEARKELAGDGTEGAR